MKCSIKKYLIIAVIVAALAVSASADYTGSSFSPERINQPIARSLARVSNMGGGSKTGKSTCSGVEKHRMRCDSPRLHDCGTCGRGSECSEVANRANEFLLLELRMRLRNQSGQG